MLNKLLTTLLICFLSSCVVITVEKYYNGALLITARNKLGTKETMVESLEQARVKYSCAIFRIHEVKPNRVTVYCLPWSRYEQEKDR